MFWNIYLNDWLPYENSLSINIFLDVYAFCDIHFIKCLILCRQLCSIKYLLVFSDLVAILMNLSHLTILYFYLHL